LETLGSTQIRSYCFRDSWALIAVKGQGALAEGRSSGQLVSLLATLPDPGSFDLTLDKAGTGTGTVTSDPPGIDCGTACATDTGTFETGRVVTLTPNAAPGSTFLGWSGDPDCANGVIAMDAAKSCTATFEKLPGLDFYTLSPCRVFDTRTDSNPIESGAPRVFPITGICEVPVNAKAISINVTVVQPSASGQVTLFPSDVPAPGTNTIGFSAGQNRANNAVLSLSADGQGSIAALATLNTQGQVHLLVDINGYFE
jgi:hypothetical protein